MKKISVYFTDPQYQAIEAKAVQAGVTFAEALRRTLDESLSPPHKGKPMSPDSRITADLYAYITTRDGDGARQPLSFRNAYIDLDEYNHTLTVRRRKTHRIIAQFDEADVSSWYQDDDEDDDEDAAEE